MVENNKSIEIYGGWVDDIQVSPFESLDILYRRSQLEAVIHELSNEERIELISYNLQLIKNAKRMSEHIGKIYDFPSTEEPLNAWWWHLDKVANGEIGFRLVPVIVTEGYCNN